MSLHIEEPSSLDRKRSWERKSTSSSWQQTYDTVCIGFGTAALPLAASLAEQSPDSRVLFVERNKQWHWQPANVLPDKEIGSPFLRDLVTAQNPRSAYTFMNYLHATKQLVHFANNSKLAPSRRLMGQYFKWAASKIEHLGWVSYGQEAVRVTPVTSNNAGKIALWAVEMTNTKSRAQSSVLAKRVVVASGAQPYIPQSLANAPLVMHSSQSDRLLANIGSSKKHLSIAIVGADQEAAEIFDHLSGHHEQAHGKHTASLFYAHSALRPEEGAPDVRVMLNRPEGLPGNVPPELRQGHLEAPTVDPHTIAAIYETQYAQKIKEPDSSKWRYQMKPLSEVIGTQREGEKVRLVIRNPCSNETTLSDRAFDIVVAATGYSFSISRSVIDIPTGLLDGLAIQVDRDYQVNFRRNALAPGTGMWLLGSLEDRKMRVDNFSWAAERAQRVSRSILQEAQKDKSRREQGQYESERAMF